MGYSHVIPELIKKFIIEKRKNKRVVVFSPTHKRAFCYIEDAILQITKLSFDEKSYYKIFNIGNMSRELKMFDLAKKIKALIYVDAKIIRE